MQIAYRYVRALAARHPYLMYVYGLLLFAFVAGIVGIDKLTSDLETQVIERNLPVYPTFEQLYKFA